MTLSTKKVNITYTAFIIVCVPLFLVFMLSGIVSGLTSDKSIDYDKVLTFSGDYYVKVSHAVYLSDENTIKFTLSSKPVENVKPKGDKPKLLTVWINTAEKDIKFSERVLDETSTEISCKLTDKQKDFSRIIVRIQYITPDEKMPDTTDAFGATVEGEVKKGSEYIERITIGRKDFKEMTAEENRQTVTEKVVLTTTTKVTEPTQSSSSYMDENSSATESDSSSEDSKTFSSTTTTTTKQAQIITTTTQQGAGTVGTTAKVTAKVTTKSYTKQATTTTKKVATTTKSLTKAADPKRPTGVSMRTNSNNYDIYLTVGQTHKAQAVVTPSTAEQAVTWSSMRPTVATVDSSGNIKAVGKGRTIITITSKNGGLKASCMVIVS